MARMLNIFYEFQIPINSSSLSRDISEQTKSIIFDYTGRLEKGSKIFRLANKAMGKWDSMLKYSGFKLSEVRRSGSPCKRNREFIIELIRSLDRREIELNRSFMIRNGNLIKLFCEDKVGSAISGNSVISASIKTFGSWDDALLEAGLDSSSIRLRSKSNICNIPIMSYQKEDVIVDGDRRISHFYGEPPETPEEIYEKKENLNNNLWSAVNEIDPADQELTERIFDIILKIHHYKDQDQLIKFIAQDLEGEASEEKIRTVFSTLSQKLR